jgi:hypothetical protein
MAAQLVASCVVLGSTELVMTYFTSYGHYDWLLIHGMQCNAMCLLRFLQVEEQHVYGQFCLNCVQTVNGQFYLAVMKHLGEAERRKRLEGWRNKTWMMHQDNWPDHTVPSP